MSNLLQDMMGMLSRKDTVTPKADDYMTLARYPNPQERMKPNPKIQTELVKISALKTFISAGSGGGAVDSIVAGTNVTVSSATGDVTVNAELGGSGTVNQLALFTANGTIGNSLLSAATSGGVNYIYAGSGSAPVKVVIPSESSLVWQKQGVAPSSASTVGVVGQMVLFYDGTAADGIYVCIASGAAGSTTWTKSALTAV